MRAHQYVGFTSRAQNAINEQNLYGVENGQTFSTGWFDGDFPLYDYVKPTTHMSAYLKEIAYLQTQITETRKLLEIEAKNYAEKVYESFLQAQPWSSGPMSYLGLKDANGHPMTELNWTEKEIEAEQD